MDDTKPTKFYENGVFYFTNPTDRDFTALWNSVEYKFPAKSSVPLLMNEKPNDIQEILKRFAKKLHDREVMQSPEFLKREKAETMTPNATEIIMQEFIDSCLRPLDVAPLQSEEVETNIPETRLSGNTAPFEGNVESVVETIEKKKGRGAKI